MYLRLFRPLTLEFPGEPLDWLASALSPSPSHNADRAGVCSRLSSNRLEYQSEMTVGGQQRGAARTPPSREATPPPRRVEFERLPGLILERLESPAGARAGRGSGPAEFFPSTTTGSTAAAASDHSEPAEATTAPRHEARGASRPDHTWPPRAVSVRRRGAARGVAFAN